VRTNEAAERSWSDTYDRAAIEAAYADLDAAKTLRALLEAHVNLNGSCERELAMLDNALAAAKREGAREAVERIRGRIVRAVGEMGWVQFTARSDGLTAILDEEAAR
jgi:acetolactate synthase small subunit